ncbi:MAG TPA: hypothetical protein DCW72_06540 [Elusimicrobia bacterium]|nr:MAG: hypothetical protein A2X29_05505 [Elusimicrobia bacterium GWA2_64_40]OGR63336.1 MAG: hypothetical protein A2X30_02120 [Elusimicrobia bacterium GWB2_63_16]HAN04084.1 hypothetical protein [Elusimicrobiota bacterium]HAU89878.1 hypothetical protein [Elusimicrobiota bacterium]
MNGLILCLALLLPAPAGAYPHDAALGAKLKREFAVQLSSSAAGRELYARLEKTKKYKALRVLVRRDKGDAFAWFDPDANAVYFNSRFILKFFDAKGFSGAQVVEVLWSNKKVRAELVKYAHPIYLHELVHALQCYLYPEYRQDAGANPLEFEYEAYLTEDMYIHERMKADPALLREFIRGSYTDIYTDTVFGTYFDLSLDPEKYREKIRRHYEERLGGYLSMHEAAEKRQAGLADSKILAYAGGRVGEYAKDKKSLERLRREKAAYAAFLEDFYRSRWPAFSADALLFVGGIALEEKNYPLALDCLAVADANAAKHGLTPEALAALKTKGAVAVLEAAAFVRDEQAKMDTETLAQHLKALERACGATGRPFPEELRTLRAANYPKAMLFYSEKLSAERDPARRDYYRENLDFFSAGAASPQD